jgi:hypothetical protein
MLRYLDATMIIFKRERPERERESGAHVWMLMTSSHPSAILTIATDGSSGCPDSVPLKGNSGGCKRFMAMLDSQYILIWNGESKCWIVLCLGQRIA